MVKYGRIRKISFIGSPEVGEKLCMGGKKIEGAKVCIITVQLCLKTAWTKMYSLLPSDFSIKANSSFSIKVSLSVGVKVRVSIVQFKSS